MSRKAPEFSDAEAAPVFAALGDANRLLLLSTLCSGQPKSIVQLTQGTTLTRQGVSKHLAILEIVRVVTSERVGRETRFAVRPKSLAEIGRYIERASRQWDDAIARLKLLVEE